MEAPDKIYIHEASAPELDVPIPYSVEYIRKDALLGWVKLAYGKVSMNPFDCSQAFEELINKINSL